MTLFVVYVPETGTVLGAVSAVGAVAPGDVGTLVGKDLPMRVTLDTGERVSLLVPARKLALHNPDDEPGVLTAPLTFGVEQVENQPPKPALVPLRELPDPPSFSDTGLVVTLPAKPTVRTPVLAWVQAGQDTVPLVGAIGTDRADVTLEVAVTPGQHGVLVLVAGWAGRLGAVTT